MCDIDSADAVTDWVETRPKARVPHECCACDETIPSGHRYSRIGYAHEGTWQVFIHCLRCRAIIEALWKDAASPAEGPIDWTLNCGEVWEEPPLHVAQLAFMTPEEIQIANGVE